MAPMPSSVPAGTAPPRKATSASMSRRQMRGCSDAADPPAAADGPVVHAMAAAGIGPGRKPGNTSSSDAAQYRKALALGDRLLAEAIGVGSTTIWTGYTGDAVVGSYGTDYLERARLAEETLGTQVPAQAAYFSAGRARSGTTTTPLVGNRSYEIRFPAATFPLMDSTASGRSRSTTPQGSLWPTRSTATQSATNTWPRTRSRQVTHHRRVGQPSQSDKRELVAGAQRCLQPRAPRVRPHAAGTRRFLVPARHPAD